ncbi:polysaccharide deacetylase family protein [Sciscionella marina]|uniref:polysaccharide deacetylase family protein n=1 Tax=Sciscionella marina TaxID=508770 RepID=UPI0003AAFB17|nr:polysaccharide deacetylase family protein [Sciscionella marina]
MGSALTWPDGKKVAAKICVALESWSDGHWPGYAPMAAAWPLPGVECLHSISWAEYGATTGVWRLLEILDRYDMRATFGVSGRLAERHPEPVLTAHAAGHELAAHSYAQDLVPGQLGPDAERENILRCTDILRRLTGSRPVGWLSPRATPTRNTPDLLTAAGYRWSGDHGDRDLPYVTSTAAGPLVCLQHSDFTDVRGALAGPRAYRDIHLDLLDYLLRQPGPGILNLTVHAHVGGRPPFADQFEQVLRQLADVREDVWIVTHQELADHVLHAAKLVS